MPGVPVKQKLSGMASIVPNCSGILAQKIQQQKDVPSDKRPYNPGEQYHDQ
jgi:hypothetical protein